MKTLKILSISLAINLLVLVPKIIGWACMREVASDDYRITFFNADVADEQKEFVPYYFSLNYEYKCFAGNSIAQFQENNQNYVEWKKALNTMFTIADFEKVVYSYNYQLVSDSLNELETNNTFIEALNKQPQYKNYFLLAKQTEGYNSLTASDDPWGLTDSVKVKPQLLIQQIEDLLNNTSSVFIKERCAYLLCRLYYYSNDAEALSKAYNILEKSNNASWIKYAANFFYVRLYYKNNTEQYVKGLIDVAEHSKDKRMIAIKLLQDDSLKTDGIQLSLHQQSMFKAIKALSYPGYALPLIKEVNDLDGNNIFINVLIGREINKLEDWLLTPNITSFKTPGSRNDNDGLSDNEYNDDNKLKQLNQLNKIKDSNYAVQFKSFIEDKLQASNNNKTPLHIYLSHLNLLLGDNEDVIKNCTYVSQHSSKTSVENLQARMDKIVAEINRDKKIDFNAQNELYNLLRLLDNRKIFDDQSDEISNNIAHIKAGFTNYLAKKIWQYGDFLHATLLYIITSKPWDDIIGYYDKDAYHFVYDHATPENLDQMIDFVNDHHKSNLESYCIKKREKQDYESDYEYKEKRYLFDNTNILYDLKGSYYVRKDSLEKALDAFKKVSNEYWVAPSTKSSAYLTGNPFKLSIDDTHEYIQDSTVKNNPNKAAFIAKILELKQKAIKEPNHEKKSLYYFQIGNAYYSMSHNGKYWIMSNYYWSNYEDAQEKSSFNDNYYGNIRALTYYYKAFQATENNKKAAFYAIYVNECKNNYKSYIFELKNKGNSEINYKWNYYLFAKEIADKTGSIRFYKRLVEECPLYRDYVNKYSL